MPVLPISSRASSSSPSIRSHQTDRTEKNKRKKEKKKERLRQQQQPSSSNGASATGATARPGGRVADDDDKDSQSAMTGIKGGVKRQLLPMQPLRTGQGGLKEDEADTTSRKEGVSGLNGVGPRRTTSQQEEQMGDLSTVTLATAGTSSATTTPSSKSSDIPKRAATPAGFELAPSRNGIAPTNHPVTAKRRKLDSTPAFESDPSHRVDLPSRLTSAPNESSLSAASARLRAQARQLPIYEALDALVSQILAHETCVLMAETGSGKSTQVVQMLQTHPKVVEYYNSPARGGKGQGRRLPTIAITQPRRLPCLSLARRVSEEMGVQLGREVGYAVRFDARENPERPAREGRGAAGQQGRTKIRYCTEGVLLRELTAETAADDARTAGSSGDQALALSDIIGEQSAESTTDAAIPPNLLLRYDVVILDEAHERTLNTDFLLGSVKRIQAVRRELARAIREAKLDKKQLETIERLCGGWEMQELKVIVMSATIEADSFSNFFDRCPILYVKGRTYPVTVWHLDDVPAPDDKVALAREQCLSIHLQRPPGGILVFMPGQEEIESLVASLKEDNKELAPGTDEIMALPLYRVLSQHQQNLVFSSTPNRKRKVIVSTNIAETGLTIPGIKYVVDAGLQKERELFGEGQGTRITSLQSVKCCRSAAEQRAGRAGRTSSGECYRLYQRSDYESRQMSATPEIQRTDLATVLLQLIAMRQNPVQFPFISPVPRDAYVYSLSELVRLDAISVAKTSLRLTALGKRMLHYPIQPFRAAILLYSFKLGCASEIIDILALQEAGNPLLESGSTRDTARESRKKYAHRDGDHLTRLKIFRAYMDLYNEDSDRTVYMAESEDSSEEDEAPKRIAGQPKRSFTAALLAWCKANALNHKVLKEAMSVRSQLRDLAKKQHQNPESSAGEELDNVLQCLCKGLHANTARLQPDGKSYRQLMGARDIKIHPTSVLFERKVPTILYDELNLTTQYYAHGVSAIEEGWITDNKAFQPAQVATS